MAAARKGSGWGWGVALLLLPFVAIGAAIALASSGSGKKKETPSEGVLSTLTDAADTALDAVGDAVSSATEAAAELGQSLADSASSGVEWLEGLATSATTDPPATAESGAEGLTDLADALSGCASGTCT